jgi:triphosphatase
MNLEIEIKFAIPTPVIPLFKAHPLLQHPVEPVHTEHYATTYYDSPDHQLKAHGFALRLRQEAGRIVQTLKQHAHSVEGFTARREWDWIVLTPHIDCDLIDIPELKDLLTHSPFVEALAPQCMTVFDRTIWLIAYDETTLIEVALDQGDIRAADRSEPIQEVELELKKGDPAALRALGLALSQTLSLVPEHRSKASRGFALMKEFSHLDH